MTPGSTKNPPRTATPSRRRAIHWTVVGLFVLIMGASAVWNLVDPEGARIEYRGWDFPGWAVYPVAVAKLAGIAVILWGRWRTLTGLAFAGFVYDLVLALGAHAAADELARGSFALFTLGVTVGAWWLDRRRHDDVRLGNR